MKATFKQFENEPKKEFTLRIKRSMEFWGISDYYLVPESGAVTVHPMKKQ